MLEPGLYAALLLEEIRALVQPELHVTHLLPIIGAAAAPASRRTRRSCSVPASRAPLGDASSASVRRKLDRRLQVGADRDLRFWAGVSKLTVANSATSCRS